MKEFFANTYEYKEECAEERPNPVYDLGEQMRHTLDDLADVEFEVCLQDIVRTTKQFLKGVPHKDKAEWNNIYLSCLLTLINMVTIDEPTLKYIETLKDVHDSKYEDFLSKNIKDKTVLVGLPESMRNYIEVLVREIKYMMSRDLSMEFHTYIPTSFMYTDMVKFVNGEDPYDED